MAPQRRHILYCHSPRGDLSNGTHIARIRPGVQELKLLTAFYCMSRILLVERIYTLPILLNLLWTRRVGAARGRFRH